MVLQTFTSNEFRAYLNKNANEINRLFLDVNQQWNKAVREAKVGQAVSLWKEGEFGNNRWVHIRHANSKKTAIRKFNSTSLCFVPVAADTFQVFEWDNSGRVNIYSSHFFDRYKERLGLKCSRDKAIRTFFRHTDVQMYVYQNEENGQFAIAFKDGLSLGVHDFERDVNICCTFVDYSLLKASQKAAFDRALPNFDNVREKADKLRRNGCSTWQAEGVVNEQYEELSKCVEEIYAEYFNRYDLC